MIYCLLAAFGFQSTAAIVDFEDWTVHENPDLPYVSSLISGSKVTLSIQSGPVSDGAGIGYYSVNGSNVASSSSGQAFSPDSNFSIAIDYDFEGVAGNATGILGVGFGIGEANSDVNSVSMTMLSSNGNPISYVGDANSSGGGVNYGEETFQDASASGALSGTLMIAYDSTSGQFTLGASNTKGASIADVSHTTAAPGGIQNRWNDQYLMASFFLRGDRFQDASGFTSGSATAEFSNFRVLEGSPVVVPEPSEIAFVTMSFLSLWAIWYRRNSRPKHPSMGQTTTNTLV